jgi:hypothetical protein
MYGLEWKGVRRAMAGGMAVALQPRAARPDRGGHAPGESRLNRALALGWIRRGTRLRALARGGR